MIHIKDLLLEIWSSYLVSLLLVEYLTLWFLRHTTLYFNHGIVTNKFFIKSHFVFDAIKFLKQTGCG